MFDGGHHRPNRFHSRPGGLRMPGAATSDVARALLANGAARQAPLDGTLKLSIASNPMTYALPNGMSSALLLMLPDYQTPYVMTISSIRNGVGRTTEMFVPSGMLLDADLNPAGEFTEQELRARVESMAAQLVFDDRRKTARYSAAVHPRRSCWSTGHR